MSNTDSNPSNPVPMSQNINIVSIVSALIVVGIDFGLPITAQQKADILVLVGLIVPALTIFLHTLINHPANQAKAAVAIRNAVVAVKKAAPVLVTVMFLGLLLPVLGACSSLGTYFDNPQNDLQIAETGFNTALALYNSICIQNPSVSICTTADIQEANSLVSAVNTAIQAAQTLIAAEQTAASGQAPSSQQISASITAVTNAVTGFDNFVNSLQTKQQAAMLAKSLAK